MPEKSLMTPTTRVFFSLLLTTYVIFVSLDLLAETTTHLSPYAGQETRTIKSLSEQDIKQLQAGEGWGLAKAAELNGLPGPAHLLQMKDEIKLSQQQIEKLKSVFDTMKNDAIRLGNKLINLEKDLNDAFATQNINRSSLKKKLAEIEKIRKELRFSHLAAHLETPGIISQQQIAEYNKLRGYNNNDPCNNIPAGHDKSMWLKHNNCN